MNVNLVVLGGLFLAGIILFANIMMYVQTKEWRTWVVAVEVLIAFAVGCLISAISHNYILSRFM